MKKTAYTLLVATILVGAYVTGFYNGTSSEAHDQNSIAKQYRGWESVSALAWDRNPGNHSLADIFSRVYFTETRALASRMQLLSADQLKAFQNRANSLSQFVSTDLVPYANALAACISAFDPGQPQAAENCVQEAIPPDSTAKLLTAL